MRPVLLVALALCGCASKKPEASAALLSQVKQALTERDAKLKSYRVRGVAHEGAQSAAFSFSYRLPNRMVGTLEGPPKRSFFFNGEQLFELSEEAQSLTTFELELPAPARLDLLTRTFSPFVCEGFRAPLLPSKGVSAKRSSHPLSPEAVELTVALEDEAQTPLSIVYTLRFPSMDFLGKRTQTPAGVQELRVEAEHCEASVGLCVPKRVSQWEGGMKLSSTEWTQIELNAPLPAEGFTPNAPPGYGSVTRKLTAP